MMFVSEVRVLSAAYLMGLAAAAPMGPVNMLAIRRGMIGGWRRTLACGIGSVAGDLILFSLVLLGGQYLLSDLSNPTLRTVLAAIGVIVLLPLGLFVLGGVGGGIVGLVVAVAGVIGLVTAATGFCPTYVLFHFSTVREERPAPSF